jgi:hypothetical protein
MVAFDSNEVGVVLGRAIIYSRAGNLAAESRFVRTLCLAVSIVLYRCRSDTATVVRRNGTMRLFGFASGVRCDACGWAQRIAAATELG